MTVTHPLLDLAPLTAAHFASIERRGAAPLSTEQDVGITQGEALLPREGGVPQCQSVLHGVFVGAGGGEVRRSLDAKGAAARGVRAARSGRGCVTGRVVPVSLRFGRLPVRGERGIWVRS
ncbi:hypothetical protein ADL08_12925, partial [Streptomyces sp. NRRL F-6492]